MNLVILNQEEFKDRYPFLKDNKQVFFISILDPDTKEKSLFKEKPNYKTWKFYDLEYDVEKYKAITYEQAKEISEFINSNLHKTLVVHCTGGVARSGAIGEYYWELLGGSYKSLMEKHPNIMPNGRVLTYLRLFDEKL